MTDEAQKAYARWREPLDKMREEFPPHQVGVLPKPYAKDSPKQNCRECGGYHGVPAVHLDFVGHAALTDRLLDADIAWSWEPFSVDDQGLPQFDNKGGLWIWLTVGGIKRIGYGDSQGKPGPNGVKEAIGDALRNAGMRFGAALSLWHKGDLHEANEARGTTGNEAAREELRAVCVVKGITPEAAAETYLQSSGKHVRDSSNEEIRAFIASLGSESA